MDMITLLGLIAATCTTASFLPQAIKTIRTRHTKDLSLGMYAVLTTGVFLWLGYGILSNDFPLIIANAITFVFVATTLILIIKYH